MLSAIKYNLSHLTDFKGRDARPTFWYYVLFLVLVQFALSFLVSIPLTGAMVGDAVVYAQQGMPEGAVQAQLMEQILYEVKRVVVGQDRFLERVA